ncbi:MAG TPA: TonB-dependent receptor [Cyclobacteriaceae bacterium]|nr:TonB-dependent receptor [Cyclobacteriaceae bacterium]HRK53558.1 TonB-dependent receptor [Cyclobacteriaceae bacterium]
MKKLIGPLLFLSAAMAGQAQGQLGDTLATRFLEELVVTGQFEPQSAKKSVYTVRTIPMEIIQARGATKLEDVLNTELNVRFSQDQALGGSNLSLQGLSGQNVKVLIDGVPMVGRQGTSNEININQINPQSVERIEIVEGPMSVVYGADALAGVINIITKKEVVGTWSLNARAQEETAGKEYGFEEGTHNQSLGGGYSWDKIYTHLDLSRNNFGGWQGNAPDRDKQWHPKKQWLASGLVGFRTEKSDVYYRLDYLNENIYNPGIFEGNEALDQDYITNRLMHQVQGSHNFSDRFNFNGAVAYTNYERKTQTSTVNKTTGDKRLALGAGLQDVNRFGGTTARGTFQYKINDKVAIQPGFDINLEQGEGGRIQSGTQNINDYAFFGSIEWQIVNGLQIRPGIRVVHNTVYKAPPVIPSINSKLVLSKHHDLRFSYGRGFRAPSLRELYFDFFDASHAIEGNQTLKAELSHSYNASWNWQVVDIDQLRFSTSLGMFYNTVENMIGFGQKPGNTLITTYLNIDRFKTKGVALRSNLKAGKFTAAVGFSYIGRFNQYIESANNLDEFTWSPEVVTTVSYKVPPAGLILSLYHKYTGATPYFEIADVGGVETVSLAKISSYDWVDFSVQKDLFKNFTLTTGVRNLFDVVNVNNTSVDGGVHISGGSRPIGYGRSYFLGISYSINNYN